MITLKISKPILNKLIEYLCTIALRDNDNKAIVLAEYLTKLGER